MIFKYFGQKTESYLPDTYFIRLDVCYDDWDEEGGWTGVVDAEFPIDAIPGETFAIRCTVVKVDECTASDCPQVGEVFDPGDSIVFPIDIGPEVLSEPLSILARRNPAEAIKYAAKISELLDRRPKR